MFPSRSNFMPLGGSIGDYLTKWRGWTASFLVVVGLCLCGVLRG
jgi:predicted MFS family arabinose efflux permease